MGINSKSLSQIFSKIFNAIGNAAGVGITVSGIITFVVGAWATLLNAVQQPIVYSCAGVFLFSLWTYIGLRLLWRENRPIITRPLHDYAYGLILDGGITMAVGKFPADHKINPGRNAIMLTCNYRNVSAGPLKMRVEEFRVLLNNRTNDEAETPLELIFARLAAMGLRAGGVPYEDKDKNLTGKLILKFVYGHPDEDFSRRYHLRVNIEVNIRSHDEDGVTAAIDNTSLNISDEPYVAR